MMKIRENKVVISRGAAVAIACGLAMAAGMPPLSAEDNAEARFRGTGKADPLRIENVRQAGGPVAGRSSVVFDLAWDHSWRADWKESADRHSGTGTLSLENWDAAWVFIKFRKSGNDGYSHATLSNSRADHHVPSGAALDVGLTDDRRRGVGVFVYRDAAGHGANVWHGVSLCWLHGADGVDNADSVDIEVLAIEMVYVPKGPFWAGDGATKKVAAQFSAGKASDPFHIQSEGAITLGGESNRNLGNRDGIGLYWVEDFNGGRTRTLPPQFPKGYEAFYCMKTEVTQGQYVAILNTVSFEQQGRLTGARADTEAGSPMAQGKRHTIKLAIPGKPPGVQVVSRRGSATRSVSNGRPAVPAVYETDTPHLACNWLKASDGAAFAAWAGLRPMTELEYEKACRGPLEPVPGEFAWGTASIAGTNSQEGPRDGYAIQNAGRPDESVTWVGENGPDATRGNAAWGGTVSQQNGSYAVNGINGPLRVGIFATPDSDRVRSGASYWGIMELTGNLWEFTVTVGHHAGRRFAGTHGDGTAVPPLDWHYHGDFAFGRRGGSAGAWKHSGNIEGISGRWKMDAPSRGFSANNGFRCVRTAP
jgi:formylglycine-generating enzyme required for sulfatase activity